MSTSVTTKKREMLPLIQAAISKLTEMSADAAKLEYQDNDQASRRLKRSIVEFKNKELSNLETAVRDVRELINGR